ncbi:MAG: hypothetical protein H8E51_06960 [Bacteroidetes bacterium]|nr:hypothetical protein [Bacteroidota bacterium]
MKVRNSFVVIDMIEIKPHKPTGLTDSKGKDLASENLKRFKEHPWQGEVIMAPEYYLNGGQKYDCDLQPGDRVVLPGKPPQSSVVVMDGKVYVYIRYSDIIYSYTPKEIKKTNANHKKR